MPLLDGDEGLKMVEMQLAITKKRKEIVWSRVVTMRRLDDTGVDMFASMIFTNLGVDYLSRYDNGC
jgi:hypothetical protein